MDLYDPVKRLGIKNPVIFVRTGSGTAPPVDLTVNGTSFDAPVPYVLDRGPAENGDLVRTFGERQFYM